MSETTKIETLTVWCAICAPDKPTAFGRFWVCPTCCAELNEVIGERRRLKLVKLHGGPQRNPSEPPDAA